MTDISASEARRNFADLLRRASTGESFTIVREGYPVARLGPISPGENTTVPEYRPVASVVTTTTAGIPDTKSGQQRRDQLLNAMTTKKRT